MFRFRSETGQIREPLKPDLIYTKQKNGSFFYQIRIRQIHYVKKLLLHWFDKYWKRFAIHSLCFLVHILVFIQTWMDPKLWILEFWNMIYVLLSIPATAEIEAINMEMHIRLTISLCIYQEITVKLFWYRIHFHFLFILFCWYGSVSWLQPRYLIYRLGWIRILF